MRSGWCRAGLPLSGRQGSRRHRPWWVWAAPFAVVVAGLLIRNAFIFTTKLYEIADMGANSILIEQARHWSLLVGNYSRDRFNHPGPAFLYVQAWGESLFWSAFHVVPTAWNGQLMGVYVLNALFAALIVAVGYGWIRSPRGAMGMFAVVAFFGALHPAIFVSDWMPYVYVLAYFTFLLALASVAAGQFKDLWIAALAGWFCLHGHACFLLFVPALTVAAVAVALWPRRRRLGPSFRSLFGGHRVAWIAALVVSALFLVPIVMELVQDWPGNFGKYFTYGSSSKAGGHSAANIVAYALWFWSPGAWGWAVLLILCAAAVAVTLRCPAGLVRRVCVSLLVLDAVSTVLLITYAAVGIDELNQYYIGYFYWSAPVVMVIVIVFGMLERYSPAVGIRRFPARAAVALGAAAAVACCALFAVSPLSRTSVSHADPGNPGGTGPDTDQSLPAGVARLVAIADGRPIELRTNLDTWPEMTGILVQSERTGVTACIPASTWTFMVTSQFICSPAERRDGITFWLWKPGSVIPHAHVEIGFRRAIVTNAAPDT